MKKDKFIAAALSQVDKGIYVWGGNGEDLLSMSDPIKWIKRKEGLLENAKRAIALFERRKAQGVNPIRAFDCSGLVYWCNKQAGIGYGDKSANGYYNVCITAISLQPSDLVFHHDGKKCTHVGIYVGDDTVVESIGRDQGVVKTKYSTRKAYWNRQGRLKKIADETPSVTLLGDANCDGKVTAADAAAILQYLDGKVQLSPQGLINADVNLDGVVNAEDAQAILKYIVGSGTLPPSTKVHMTGSLCVRDGGAKTCKLIGYAHKGHTYPVIGVADTGWYHIEYKEGKYGYISDKTKYTELEN